MRIPLTKYGWPQVVVFPAALIVAMIVLGLGTIAFLPAWAVISIEIALAAVLVWVLMFFRDPERLCPSEPNLLLAPADGRVTTPYGISVKTKSTLSLSIPAITSRQSPHIIVSLISALSFVIAEPSPSPPFFLLSYLSRQPERRIDKDTKQQI